VRTSRHATIQVVDPFSYVRHWRGEFADKGWWHSFELPDGSRIDGVSDLDAQKRRIAQFPIPGDLRGKRVLDIGAWDGWFSFEMERRGADVVAIDRWENPRFYEIRSLLGSRVDYRELDVYDLHPDKIGTFDIVLFMGVLYHVKHPLLALERVCSVTTDMAIVESFVLKDQTDRNLLEFFEYDEFGGQFDNWFGPTPSCLTALCRTAGFARVDLNRVQDFGAAVTCYRRWEETPSAGDCKLLAAVHAENFGINFRSDRDDYVACCLEGEPAPRPTVAGFGSHPIFNGPTDAGYWQVNFKLPPGLPPGWHPVRVGGSNAVEIAVDLALDVSSLKIVSACDGVTWERGRVSLERGHLSLWAEGLPRNADVRNVRVSVDGIRQRVTFVGKDGQVNVRIAGEGFGKSPVRVECAGVASEPVEVEFTR
jgi:tRNA (mo5U34)-methyltransferase